MNVRLASFLLFAFIGLTPVRAGVNSGPHYVWFTYIPGKSVAFGVPDTDDRALRIDCAGSHMLEIIGPADGDPADGTITSITLEWSGHREVRRGKIGVGDIPQFIVPVASNDPAVRALLEERAVIVGNGHNSWTVPGHGARRVLTPLLRSCR